MSGGRLSFAFALAFALFGCDDAPLPDTESQAGDLLTYAWDPALTPCGGNVRAMDGFIEDVSDALGVDPRALDPITYTWLLRDDFYAQRPQLDFPGTGVCYGSTAYGADPVVLHELVHAIDAPRGGTRRFFVEGLAVAFDPPIKGGERYARSDPRPFLTTTYDDELDDVYELYQSGGAFVAYLLSRHGAGRFRELQDRLGPRASEARIRRIFGAVYGRELDDEVNDFLGDACPEEASETPRPHACEGEVIPWESPTTWRDGRSLACESESAVGGHGEVSSTVEVAVALDVPESGAYELRAFGDRSATTVLAPCGRCPWLAVDTRLKETPELVRLEAGRHALIYRGEARAVALVGVQIVRAPEHDDDAI